MEIGLGFDDSDFTESRKKEKEPLKSYNAKTCVPLWFNSEEASDRESEESILKYRADYYYHRHDYKQAAQCYSKALGLLNATNRTMKREVQDALARCHMFLGNRDQALQLADVIMQDSSTANQMCQTLVLLQQLYNKFSQWADERWTLERLLTLHPTNPHFWLLLADGYAKFLSRSHYQPSQTDSATGDTPSLTAESIPPSEPDRPLNSSDRSRLPQESVSQTAVNEGSVTDCNQVKQTTEETNKHIALACYMRAKWLLRNVANTDGTFVGTRNSALIQQTKERIQILSGDEADLHQARACLKKDELPDNDRSSKEADGTSEQLTWDTLAKASQDFTERWFSRTPLQSSERS